MKPCFAEVTEAVGEILEFETADRLREDSMLETELGMDSGMILELIMLLEESVDGLVVDQSRLTGEQFRSVGTVCDYVAAGVKAKEVA